MSATDPQLEHVFDAGAPAFDADLLRCARCDDPMRTCATSVLDTGRACCAGCQHVARARVF